MPSLLLLQRDHEASPRLADRIRASRRFSVAATVHTLEDARLQLARAKPDVLMTDLRVQDGDALGLLGELRLRHRRPHVLVTMLSHDDGVLLDALRAGADGYWVHTGSHDDLIEVLQQISRGESRVSPSIARQMLSHFDEPPHSHLLEPLPFSSMSLSAVERQILQFIAQGYLVDEIARRWHASAPTVARGIRRAVQKLQIERRARHVAMMVA